MRQQRAIELINDYDCEILYHPGKANVVADALSRNAISGSIFYLSERAEVEFALISELKKWQKEAWCDQHMKAERMVSYVEKLSEDAQGLKCFENRIWVPKMGDLREYLLTEAHQSRLSVHPGTAKMYRDLRKDYWWPGMKRDVGKYVEKCLVCLQVKAEHQKPYGNMQPLPIPEWKWLHITMDFVTKLPRTQRNHDSIWVIVDRLTKSAHFIAISEKYHVNQLAKIYIDEIVALHGVPKSIVSDRDSRFTSRFWKSFQEQLGTKVNLSTAYHPETDGQSERTIQTMEDMLRACILEFGGNWDTHLSLIEFSYNNSYHTSIKMAPFEALYGRKCRTPTCWREAGETPIAGPELLQQAEEKIRIIRENIKAAQDRQKSYKDKRRKDIEFVIGDLVMLKVSPWKGLFRFGKKGKLAPRFVGPFKIIDRVGTQAYQLQLPASMAGIHDVFNVSHLRKCLAEHEETVPLEEIQLDERLRYVEEPERVVNEKTVDLRGRKIDMVLVEWKHHRGPNWTWENKSEMMSKYPQLFV